MDFGQFYQDGGVFMHVITLLTFFVGGTMVRRVRTLVTLRQRSSSTDTASS